MISIPFDVTERLVELAKRSLDTNDVPIAAILMYHSEIIGEGWNTVLAENNAAGHAEVNAISDALKRMGSGRFETLDREHLLLVSTFEPCLMCIGACINASIRAVAYLQPKEWRDLLRERKALALHFVRRKRVRNSGEQLALFRLHPDFERQHGYRK